MTTNNRAVATKLNILKCKILRYTSNEGRSIRIMTTTVQQWADDIREIELELNGPPKAEDNSY